jgi:hypothetical protein
MNPYVSRPGTIGSFAGALALIVGTFLPWASSKGMVLKGFEGFDGFVGSAGFFVIVAGLLGLGVAVANLVSRKLGASTGLSTILVGLAGAGLGALQVTLVRVEVGIGLWVVIVGGVDLIAAGVFHLTYKPEPMITEPPRLPASAAR